MVLQHHPDRGGDTKTMQDINNLYQNLLSGFDNTQNSEGFTYRYNAKKENDLMNLFYKIVSLDLDGLIVEIIGSWLWVSGETTKKYKKELKSFGLKWSRNKKSLYFHFDGYFKNHNGNYSLDDIRKLWGIKESRSTQKFSVVVAGS